MPATHRVISPHQTAHVWAPPLPMATVARIGCAIAAAVLVVPVVVLVVVRALERTLPNLAGGWIALTGYMVVAVAAAAGLYLLPRIEDFGPITAQKRQLAEVGSTLGCVWIVALWSLAVTFGDTRGVPSERGFGLLAVVVVGTVLVAPVFEEVWARGLLYGFLRAHLSPYANTLRGYRRLVSVAPVALLTSTVFAVGHFLTASSFSDVAGTIPVGLALTAAYEITGRLWVPIASHVMINAIAIGSDLWGSSGAIAAYLLMIVVVVVVSFSGWANRARL